MIFLIFTKRIKSLFRKIHFKGYSNSISLLSAVRAWIDENGSVVKTEVLKGIGYGCDSSAVAAVLKLKFVPGKNHGKAVKTEVVIPVMFKLQ